MRKVILLMLAAAMMALPVAATAGTSVKGPKQSTYQLEGALSAYTPSAGPGNGSITIIVTKANHAGQPFIGQTLTFAVTSSTHVSTKTQDGTIADGVRGQVQVKAGVGVDATGLQASPAKSVNAKNNALKPVDYDLHGTLSAYTAPVGATNGSITILVASANAFGQAFVGLSLTFAVSSTTDVTVAGAGIADGDQGTVSLTGAVGLSALALQALVPETVTDETV
jgi:hypothetical protein